VGVDNKTLPGEAGRRTRRQMMAAGACAIASGAAAVYQGLLPGRHRLTTAYYRRVVIPIEGCGGGLDVPQVSPGPVKLTAFSSAARRREVSMVVAYPPGYGPRLAGEGTASSAAAGRMRRPLPVCLVLTGREDEPRCIIDKLDAPTFLAAAVAAGAAPFVLAAVDGGLTYYHRRENGDDPETMIFDEVLPRLAAAGLRTDRFAAYGWSMGAYGALLLARHRPDRLAAAVASSPAVFFSYWDVLGLAPRPMPPFDSAADFEANRVLGVGPAPGVAYWIDCGIADEYNPVARVLARELAAESSFPAGCHIYSYWRRQLPAQLAFIGRVLSALPEAP
jgi:S-formylglutathione hydrolase FrmB